MDQTLLYGFILDGATSAKAKSDINNQYNQGVGVLIDEPANYLVNKAYLTDIRDNRLDYKNNTKLAGKLEIVYDANKTETLPLSNLTTEQQSCLFNIIECVYTQNTQADDVIENKLTTDSVFDGYVEGSYHHSTEFVSAEAINNDATTTTLRFNNWVQFEYRTPEVWIEFKLWISNQAFATQYPFVTITNVIPPYDLRLLTNPGALVQLGNLAVLQAGSSYIFSKTNLEAISRDQNGVYTFSTKYVIDTRTSINIPFALPYCGAHEPSSLDARRYIREYLQEHAEIADDELKILFPEVYIDNRFYIVPVYDRFISRAGKDFYPSIWKPTELLRIARKVYTDLSPEYIETNLELITNSQNKMISLVIPDENNSAVFSVLEDHPTYQDYATTEAGFRYMDGTTQEFSAKLARAMAVVNGVSTANEFPVTTEGNLSYVVFAQSNAEYLIMFKDSYDSLVEGV